MTNEIMETETDSVAVIRPDVEGAVETMRLFQQLKRRVLDLVNRITKNDPKAMDYIAYYTEKQHVQDLTQLDKVQGSELIDAITDYKNGKKVAPSYRTDEEFQAWLRAQAEAPA